MSGEAPTQAAPTTAVAKPKPAPDRTPLMQRDPTQLATMFFQSGYFTDVKSQAQAVVKMVAGEELGLAPMTAMQGIHIIEGKPSLSANLLGVLVKRSERYDFKPIETSAEKAVIAFYQDGDEVGRSEFTIDQARQIDVKQKGSWIKLAETSRWKHYPQAMLVARALSQGVRWYCPDVAAGAPYTPEELGADVNESGEPLRVENLEVSAKITEPEGLDPDFVELLQKGIELAGLDLDHLNVLLGSIGVDGFDPLKDREEQLAALTPEQAAALDAALQKKVEAESGGEEADDAGN